MIRQPEPLFAAGVVPVPNQLFDELLPRLSDTQLRLLLVVYRQTVGFREGSNGGGWQFKERDWLSHAQLCKRTGRGSAAVSAAIQSLIDGGFMMVEAANRRALVTAAERRRHLGRLYFRPVDKWKTPRQHYPRKAKTTTNKRTT